MKYLPIIFVSVIALNTPTNASADIYRWVDKKTGEIVFAETPPPPEVSTEYENITPKLNQKKLTKQTIPEKQDTAQETSETALKETTEVLSDEELLLQHRCQSLTAEIDALERLLTETSDDDEMDKTVIKLASAEKNFQQRCK